MAGTGSVVAVALVVVACCTTLVAASPDSIHRKLLAAQVLSNPEGLTVTPKEPSVAARKTWGPNTPTSAAGDRRLLAAQAFGNPVTPKEPAATTRKSWDPKFPASSSGSRKLLVA